MLQTRLAGELEQHKARLLGAFDNLHSRIMEAKTLAAAACKPVRQQEKVRLLLPHCPICTAACLMSIMCPFLCSGTMAFSTAHL